RRRHPTHRGGSGNVRRAGGRRVADLRAGGRPADGPALLPVLTYSLLDLLQITDRSFPTGGFVHSQGLEWLVKEERLSLEEILALRLREQLGRFELVFLAHAYTAPAPDLDERFHSMVLPRESREASSQ